MNACVFDVLVENLEQVKITDFGLAKVLEHNQEQIYGGGGKVLFSRGVVLQKQGRCQCHQKGSRYFMGLCSEMFMVRRRCR